MTDVFQMRVPFRAACKADMRIWSDVDRAIDAPGRHDYQSAIQLNARKGRSTFSAKASFVPGLRNPVGADAVMTGNPTYRRRRREQIGRMRRPRVLSAALAVTKKEALELTRDLKPDGATQTGTSDRSGHISMLIFV
jgi:hypothetical protein